MAAPIDEFIAARDLLVRLRLQRDEARSQFQWPRLETFNWALEHFDNVAAGEPQRGALQIERDDGAVEARTYAELSTRSNQVANYLRSHGARRGDRLLLVLGNDIPLWEVMLACIKLGVVVIPATMLLSAADLEDRVGRGEASFVVADQSQIDKLAALRGPLTKIVIGAHASGWLPYDEVDELSTAFEADGPTPAGDPLLLYFTSGTTAQPKLVQHSHVSYPIGHLSTMYWIGLQPGDVHLNISSPGWAKHAWSCLFAPWNAAATVLVLDHARFDADRTLAALVRHGVTTFCAPPTVWRMLVQRDLDQYPTTLREAVAAGEPLNPEIIDHVRRSWGLTVRDGFGQTETTALIGNSPGGEVREGSMGMPLPGYDILLVDADGNPVDEGEIAIDLSANPTGVMSGYRGDDERTAAATSGGLYRTGDIASRDADGYYTYVGRADDVFKASDYRISPFELESVLLEHPAVLESAVVPSPDPVRLATPKAFVVLAEGWNPDEKTATDILAFARQRLGAFKRIRRIEFAELPKTISGKIRRVELRQSEHERDLSTRRAAEYWEEDLAAPTSG